MPGGISPPVVPKAKAARHIKQANGRDDAAEHGQAILELEQKIKPDHQPALEK